MRRLLNQRLTFALVAIWIYGFAIILWLAYHPPSVGLYQVLGVASIINLIEALVNREALIGDKPR